MSASSFRCPFSVVLICGLGWCLQGHLAAQLLEVSFAKVADKTDVVPGTMATFQVLEEPAISGENVAFSYSRQAPETPAGIKKGIVARINGELIRIVEEGMTLPAGMGEVKSIEPLVSIFGDRIAFAAVHAVAGGVGKYSIFGYLGGTIVIIREGGGECGFSEVVTFRSPYLAESSVSYIGSVGICLTPTATVTVNVSPWPSSTASSVLYSCSSPGCGPTIPANGGSVFFTAGGFLYENSTPVFNFGFQSPNPYASASGEEAAVWVGGFDDSPGNGFYRWSNGSLMPIIQYGEPVNPCGDVKFKTETARISISQGKAVFQGSTYVDSTSEPAQWALFTDYAGATQRIVGPGNPLLGDAISGMGWLHPQAFDGNNVTFVAAGSGSGGSSNQGVYVATLSIKSGDASSAPMIQTQPMSLTVCPDGTASFAVTASGAETLHYQWEHNGVPLVDSGGGGSSAASRSESGGGSGGSCSIISGSDTATLEIFNVCAEDAGVYDVVVSNACGSIFSEAATLLTLCAPWVDLGSGLAGVGGIPLLTGSGPLTSESSGSLELTAAAPSAFALLFISLSSNPAPFKCGTLVPVPWVVSLSLATNGEGAIPLAWPAWPSGLSGLSLYWQYGVQDASAICGASLSNALRADVP